MLGAMTRTGGMLMRRARELMCWLPFGETLIFFAAVIAVTAVTAVAASSAGPANASVRPIKISREDQAGGIFEREDVTRRRAPCWRRTSTRREGVLHGAVLPPALCLPECPAQRLHRQKGCIRHGHTQTAELEAGARSQQIACERLGGDCAGMLWCPLARASSFPAGGSSTKQPDRARRERMGLQAGRLVRPSKRSAGRMAS